MKQFVTLEKIKILASIGVNPIEKKRKQYLTITLTFSYDAEDAVRQDDITKAIDYSLVEAAVISITHKRHYELLESLIYTIKNELSSQFNSIDITTIKVRKESALKQGDAVIVSYKQ